MQHTGSRYEGTMVNGRMEGEGKYFFPNGNVYVGEFLDGSFHGEGTIYFPEKGKFCATWRAGTAVDGVYSFRDGLVYQPTEEHKAISLTTDPWPYCKEDDRRYHTEHLNGLQPAGQSQLVDNEPVPVIPDGCFDVGDGYFNPEMGLVYGYAGKFLRAPSLDELQWIPAHCRRGGGTADPPPKSPLTDSNNNNNNNNNNSNSMEQYGSNSSSSFLGNDQDDDDNGQGSASSLKKMTAIERLALLERELAKSNATGSSSTLTSGISGANYSHGASNNSSSNNNNNNNSNNRRLPRNVKRPIDLRARVPEDVLPRILTAARACNGPAFLGLFADGSEATVGAGLLSALQACAVSSRGDLRKQISGEIQRICTEFEMTQDSIPRHVQKGGCLTDIAKVRLFSEYSLNNIGAMVTDVLSVMAKCPPLQHTASQVEDVRVQGTKATAFVDGRVIRFATCKFNTWTLVADLSYIAQWNPVGDGFYES